MNEVEYFDGNKDTDSYEPGWYFWDETWTYPTGPFDTQEHAKKELEEYAKTL